jgi:hypothetical protein
MISKAGTKISEIGFIIRGQVGVVCKTKESTDDEKEPIVVFPTGGFVGDFYVLNKKKCPYTMTAIKDDEIKTYSPEDWNDKNAGFSVTVQEKYHDRRQTENFKDKMFKAEIEEED